MKTSKKKNAWSVIPCGVALIRRGREFLIAQRDPEDTLGSFWEFPGGKQEPNESFEECVAREAMEELGIGVAVHEKFSDIRKKYKRRIIWLNFYLCSHISGEPKPIDCQNVRWVDVTELKNFKFPPANAPIIDKLMELWGNPAGRDE